MKKFGYLIFTLFIQSVAMNAQTINPHLKQNIKELIREDEEIFPGRKQELQALAQEIHNLIMDKNKAEVTFVCTHNSRRSQLAELWLRAACKYYDVENVQAFSGGTEATAFNERMVDAAVRFGFTILKEKSAQNPRYIARLSDSDPDEAIMFSKKYDDPFNPEKDFIAVMVCSQADRDCPFVPGAFSRVSLPYEDPKAFDDTVDETMAYDNKVREIGREILFMVGEMSRLTP